MGWFFRPVFSDLLLFCSSFFPFIASPFGFPMCGENIDFQRKELLCGEWWGTRHMVQAKHLWVSDSAVLLHGPWVHLTRVLRRKEYDTRTFQEPWCMRNRMNLLEETVKKIRALYYAKPTSLTELCCSYLLPFLLNCSVYLLLPSCSAENKSRGEQRWLILQLVERLIKCVWCWHLFTAAWTRGWQIAGGVWAAPSLSLTQPTAHRPSQGTVLGECVLLATTLLLQVKLFTHTGTLCTRKFSACVFQTTFFVAFSRLFRRLIGLPTSTSFSFGLVTKTFCLQWSCCCAVVMMWISTQMEADAQFEHNLSSWFCPHSRTQLCAQNHW